LWTIDGHFIGTFGQEAKWNLKNPKTFHSHILNNTNEFDKDSKAHVIKIIYEEGNGKYDESSQILAEDFVRRESKIHFPDIPKVTFFL